MVSEVIGFDSRLQSYEVSTKVTPHMAFQTQQSGSSDNSRQSSGYYVTIRDVVVFSLCDLVLLEVIVVFRLEECAFLSKLTLGWNPSSANPNGSHPICQVCGIISNIALQCWNCFDNTIKVTIFLMICLPCMSLMKLVSRLRSLHSCHNFYDLTLN